MNVVYLSFESIVHYYLVLGMMAMGAINVVRGSRSSVDELLQIYNHSERFANSVVPFSFFLFSLLVIVQTIYDQCTLFTIS